MQSDLPAQAPRILFHAPGLAAHRPAMDLPHVLGVQPATMHSIQGLLTSHELTGNRGNIIHAEAPAKLFKRDPLGSAYGNIGKLHKHLGDAFADRMAELFDMIVISMANFIRPDHSVENLGHALVALDGRVPFIVLGAGLQGRHELSAIRRGSVDTIGVINERAALFGVRGEETCGWLHKHGFKKAEVLGCPSLYVYPQSIMILDPTAARQKGANASVMTAGHLAIKQGNIVRRGTDLVKALAGTDASYVMQDEFIRYPGLRHRPCIYSDGNSQFDSGFMNAWLTERCKRPVSFRNYYYFNESGAWRQSALRHDVFIGDRFHGGVAALQAGLPTIFLKEDNRVGELTDYFALPALSISQFTELGLAKTLEKMLDDGKITLMKTRYRQRFRHFRKRMKEQGLTVVSRLPD